MNFKIGMKVVSLYDFTKERIEWGFNYPKKGDVLTVRTAHLRSDGNWFLRFEEIHNTGYWFEGIHMEEPELWGKHFVPLLSTFQRITFERVLELVETSSN